MDPSHVAELLKRMFPTSGRVLNFTEDEVLMADELGGRLLSKSRESENVTVNFLKRFYLSGRVTR